MSIVTRTYEDDGRTTTERVVVVRKTDTDLIELASFDDAPFRVSILAAPDDYPLDEAAGFAREIDDAVYKGRALNGEHAKQAEDRRQYDEDAAIAQATPCGIDGCDGDSHEPYADPSTWNHRIECRSFDNGVIEAEIIYSADRGCFAYMVFDTNAEVSPAELNADAELYASYPAWIRSLANRVDALNNALASR